MSLSSFKTGIRHFLAVLCLAGCSKDSGDSEPTPAARKQFQKTFLLEEFGGNVTPSCGEGAVHIEQGKRALALLELGMKGVSLEDYRKCYKPEFLK